MLRVDFYIIDDPKKNRERVICQIAEKAYKKNCRCYMRVSDQVQLSRMDDLLWMFREGSFVPHDVLSTTASAVDVPILIGSGQAPTTHRDVLFNLADDVAEDYTCFQRVIEVLDETGKQAGRSRYQRYKQDNCVLETHHI